MMIELRATEEVRPYENNPRLNDATVAEVVRSLEKLGSRKAMLVDAEGVIIVGHTWWMGAQQLGLSKILVQLARYL